MAKAKGGGASQKKHAVTHKKIRQDGRPNGKRWKKGLPPDKRK